jgi:hypothetical protein
MGDAQKQLVRASLAASRLALDDLNARLAPLDRYGLAELSTALVECVRALFGASRVASSAVAHWPLQLTRSTARATSARPRRALDPVRAVSSQRVGPKIASVRAVQLLFEPSGASFAKHVLSRRLEQCRASLTSRISGGRSRTSPSAGLQQRGDLRPSVPASLWADLRRIAGGAPTSDPSAHRPGAATY